MLATLPSTLTIPTCEPSRAQLFAHATFDPFGYFSQLKENYRSYNRSKALTKWVGLGVQ